MLAGEAYARNISLLSSEYLPSYIISKNLSTSSIGFERVNRSILPSVSLKVSIGGEAFQTPTKGVLLRYLRS